MLALDPNLRIEKKEPRDSKLYTRISTAFCVCARKTGSHSLDQTDLEAIMYVVQTSLKCSEVLLPQFPECWGYKYEMWLSLANIFYSLDIILCILGLPCTYYITKDQPEFLTYLHYPSGLDYRHAPLYSGFI